MSIQDEIESTLAFYPSVKVYTPGAGTGEMFVYRDWSRASAAVVRLLRDRLPQRIADEIAETLVLTGQEYELVSDAVTRAIDDLTKGAA